MAVVLTLGIDGLAVRLVVLIPPIDDGVDNFLRNGRRIISDCFRHHFQELFLGRRVEIQLGRFIRDSDANKPFIIARVIGYDAEPIGRATLDFFVRSPKRRFRIRRPRNHPVQFIRIVVPPRGVQSRVGQHHLDPFDARLRRKARLRAMNRSLIGRRVRMHPKREPRRE